MYPGVRLVKAFAAIQDQKCQWVVRIVSMLSQQHSTEVALHRHQAKRRPALMSLQPSCPATTEVAEPVEDNYSVFALHCLSLPEQCGPSTNYQSTSTVSIVSLRSATTCALP